MEKQHPQINGLNVLQTYSLEQNPRENNKPNIKNQQPSSNSFSSIIIQMMKKIRKNSPLFKPIKKLKTSIQVIGGEDNVSFYEPSSTLIVFHFGLGNQVDKQIILNSTSLSLEEQKIKLLKDFVILPGKPFSFIEFCCQQDAQKFVAVNKMGNIFEEANWGDSKNEAQLPQVKQNTSKQEQKDQQYIGQQFKPPVNSKQPLVYYSHLKHNNLQRMMIFFYLNKAHSSQHNKQSQNQLITIPNCSSKYSPLNNIPGLHLIEQIITQQQELQLLQWIDQQPWQKLSNRRVQHYGYEFKYGQNAVDKNSLYKNSMPHQLHFLLQKLTKLVFSISGLEIDYDQLTINDYFAGHGIPSHFDTHSPFEEYFVAVSMLSGIVMDWKRYDGTQKSTYLKERSVVVFSGQARYAWQHSIACRKLDNVDNQLKHRSRRISLTFRKIKRTPCECKYCFYCDSQGYDQNTMKKNNPLLNKYLCEENKHKLKGVSPQQIYQQYVIKAYNSFGYDFHNKVIPEIKQYLMLESVKIEESPQSKLVLDIGCGNGEYQKHLKSDRFYYVGLERCQVMQPLEEEVHMDGLRLGFRDGLFDIVLLVAVLHHFVSEDGRLKCIKQAKRVMGLNGVLYLTVFNYQSKKQQYPQQDILLDYCLPSHKAINNSRNGQTEIEYKKDSKQYQETNGTKQKIKRQEGKKTQKGQIYSRYYHLFKREELLDLIQKSGLKVEQLQMTKENIVLKLTHILQH